MAKLAFLSGMLGRFRRDERGNVLIMTAFLLVPLIGIAGITVDYSRASNTRQSLSAAIDSAALMAARDAQKLTDDELKKRVEAWIRDNLPESAKSEFTAATVAIDRTARTVKIEANGAVPTTISRVLGQQSIAVASNSQATWGTNTIELALVLDNTGSMAAYTKTEKQNGKRVTITVDKIGELKKAAKSLIGIMKDASIEPGQIKLSIVPFNTQVRISRSFANEPWIRYDLSRKVTCDSNGKNCTLKDGYNTPISDTTGLNCTAVNNKKVCTTQSVTKATWSKSSEGCVVDRDQSYDVSDGGAISLAEQYPGYWCAQSSLAEVMGLSEDWTALTSRVDAMSAAGNTNITIGAAWGWATLSPGVPFTEAKPLTEPRLKKYMIVLTDGDNTESRESTSGSDIDKRTILVCDNAKKYGITVYTIRVIDGNETLLQNCATDKDKYYNVTDATQLEPIFKQIANEISQVRLTH